MEVHDAGPRGFVTDPVTIHRRSEERGYRGWPTEPVDIVPAIQSELENALATHACLEERDQALALRRRHTPANQAYPPSGDVEPKPLPNLRRSSVTASLLINLTFL